MSVGGMNRYEKSFWIKRLVWLQSYWNFIHHVLLGLYHPDLRLQLRHPLLCAHRHPLASKRGMLPHCHPVPCESALPLGSVWNLPLRWNSFDFVEHYPGAVAPAVIGQDCAGMSRKGHPFVQTLGLSVYEKYQSIYKILQTCRNCGLVKVCRSSSGEESCVQNRSHDVHALRTRSQCCTSVGSNGNRRSQTEGLSKSVFATLGSRNISTKESGNRCSRGSCVTTTMNMGATVNPCGNEKPSPFVAALRCLSNWPWLHSWYHLHFLKKKRQ